MSIDKTLLAVHASLAAMIVVSMALQHELSGVRAYELVIGEPGAYFAVPRAAPPEEQRAKARPLDDSQVCVFHGVFDGMFVLFFFLFITVAISILRQYGAGKRGVPRPISSLWVARN